MGMLGILLFYISIPILFLFYPDVGAMTGDEVWPSMIATGVLWSLGFLAAGWVNKNIVRDRLGQIPRSILYLAVLWLSAALLWLVMLASQDIRFATEEASVNLTTTIPAPSIIDARSVAAGLPAGPLFPA